MLRFPGAGAIVSDCEEGYEDDDEGCECGEEDECPEGEGGEGVGGMMGGGLRELRLRLWRWYQDWGGREREEGG